MKKILLILALFVSSTILQNCFHDEDIYLIALDNISSQSFYAIPSFDHPDTSFTSIKNSNEIKPNTISYIGSQDGWIAEIESISTEILIIFLVDKDTLSSYELEDIFENYRITKRYNLTVSQLDSLDWTITYP